MGRSDSFRLEHNVVLHDLILSDLQDQSFWFLIQKNILHRTG